MSTFARENFSDQLSIETPEGVALRFPVAGMGSRAIAVLIDHLIQGGAYGLIAWGLYLLGSAAGEANKVSQNLDTAGKWFIAGVVLVLFCIWWGYFALFEALWRGQTPGKHIMKLRVIKDAGRQITFFEAAARNLMRVIDYLPSWYVAGVITMACNKQNKRLGDLVAGTIVVHEGREEQPMVVGSGFLAQTAQTPADGWAVAYAREAVAAGGMFPADALARLGASDLLVIDKFFARALDLPMETRASMAQRVAASLCTKMGVPVPEGNPERVLEGISSGMRSGGRRF